MGNVEYGVYWSADGYCGLARVFAVDLAEAKAKAAVKVRVLHFENDPEVEIAVGMVYVFEPLPDALDRQDAIDTCRRLARECGRVDPGWNLACATSGGDFVDACYYEDAVIRVWAAKDTPALTVDVKQDTSGGEYSNVGVVWFTASGENPRNHGDFVIAQQHLARLRRAMVG